MPARICAALLTLSLVAGGGAPGARAARQASTAPSRPGAPPSPVVVFAEPGFPSVDLDPIDDQGLRQALSPFAPHYAAAAALPAALGGDGTRVLVMPYGSAFPRDAWPAVLRFLQNGGSLVQLGGIPFSVPVSRSGAAFVREAPTTAYSEQLGIARTFDVPAESVAAWVPGDPASATSPLLGAFSARQVFPLDVRLSSTKENPDEGGSTGPRAARLQPLVLGVDAGGTRVSAPFVRIDRLQGAFGGGAWLLAPLAGRLDPTAVRALVDEARVGATEFVVRPTFAGFRPGEPVSLSVTLRRPGSPGEVASPTCFVEVLEAAGRSLVSMQVPLAGTARFASARVEVPLARPVERGLYKVRATIGLAVPGPEGAAAPVRFRSTSGFWVYDTSMLTGGTSLTVEGGQVLRDGRPYPVIGTTYMAPTGHREFLLEPNPYLWDRDLASMATAGVNLVRTGLWSGWRPCVPEADQLPEGVLRALDVFLLTARKHDIPVVLTAFAVVAPARSGDSPCLAPRSPGVPRLLSGQLARRYAGVRDMVWDLVDETGPMRHERTDGSSWRSERDAASLLERRLAVALGTGAAGAVQVNWNTNPYAPGDNEAGIGLFRVDGTARPELRPFVEISRFVRANAGRLAARAPEEVALVVPQSQMLSVRDDGAEATRRAIRTMCYRLQVPVRAVGGYQVSETLGTPRLILLPAPAVLSETAWKSLLAAVERGSVLLATGDVDRDECGRHVPRSSALGWPSARRAVTGEEPVVIDGARLAAGYRGEKLERLERAVVAGQAQTDVVRIPRGRGTILWMPLPVELAESPEPTVALYRAALAVAGVTPAITVSPVSPGLVVGVGTFGDTALVALASETSEDLEVTLTHERTGTGHPVRLPAGRAILVLVDSRTGALLDRSNPPGLRD